MKPGVYKVMKDGRVLLDNCEYSKSLWFRFKGLMLSPKLPPTHGLLLKPCNSVHMFFMRYALDIVFLDKELRIIRVCSSLKPWHLSPIVWRAQSALECAAGWADRHGLKTGDTIYFESVVQRTKGN